MDVFSSKCNRVNINLLLRIKKTKMKINILLCCFAVSLLCSCGTNKKYVSSKELEKTFVTAPDSIKTSVYWYWMQDNMSKEGVVKDLQAMKAAGINRAFIGSNIGGPSLSEVPTGKVKLLSDEWWDIIHTTLKTAGDLGIEIGIFNSPGWSQSGGPWVKPTEAMRYLTSSELRITGPKNITVRLEKPAENFQDVKVIAYPAPKGGVQTLSKSNVKIDANSKVVLDFDMSSNFIVRSISIYPKTQPINAKAAFQVKTNNGYQTISTFDINRYNPALNVGFNPYGPIVITIPTTSAKSYRLIVNNAQANCGLEKVELSSSPMVERYVEKSLGKMCQTPFPYWSVYLWPQQYNDKDSSTVIDPTKVLDISKNMSPDGTLTWNVPDGSWVIFRTGMTPTGVTNSPATPAAIGLEIDKLSKKHVETHFNAFIGQILKRIPAEDRKTFKVVVMDSYETGGQNFTDDFLNIFKERYGYDPLPYIPVFKGKVVGSQDISDSFLWDVRRLVADKVSYDYVGGLKGISHKHGLTTWLENYGHWGFPGEFLQYGGQSDEIGGEFWSEGALGDIENRAASSCGHIYGKNRISAESFTCAGAAYSRYPASMKQRADKFFAEGINHTVLCLFIHQPYEDKDPGINAAFGNEFNRKNTWFSQSDVFIKYLKRCNYMLQQGLNVADVAYFIGEDAPKMTGITDPALPTGYQFDYINAEVIVNNLSVKNGLLTLPHGTQYKILVLPKLETMRPECLRKIVQLVKDGAVILGPAPKRSPSLQNQPMANQQVKAMAAELWGEVDGVNLKSRKFGKGMVINGMDLKEAFALIGSQPDCKLPDDNTIHFGHRTLGKGEIYFLSNQTAEVKIINPEFRVKGMQPELWEATSGNTRNLTAFHQKDNTTIVPIKLEPFESVFVVFRKPGVPTTNGLITNYPKPTILTETKTPWQVSFESKFRTPKPIIINKLQDLVTFDNDSIKYFSGTATYTNSFMMDKLPENKKIFISLDKVSVMAKVSINGQYVGGVWTSPYKLDITKFVTQGDNLLKIEVVNTWVNRLIGDLNLLKSQQQVYSNVNPYNAQSTLQSSGLIGKVIIACY